MGGGTQGGDEDGLITDINVTPLVDVVLVLLIILMVFASAVVSQGFNVDLPEAASAEPTAPDLTISIDAAGSIYFNELEVSEEQLRQRVRQARRENPEVRAVIAGDGRIAYRNVVRVIDLLRQENVNKFAINVRQSDTAGETE